MSVYIYGIICASVAIGIAELLVPESAKTRPYIKLIFSLALLAVIVKPLGELAEMLPTLGERIFAEEFDGGEYDEIADSQLGEAYREGIKKALGETFSLSNFDVGVLMGEERKPSRVIVTLMGNDIFRDPYKIEEYVGKAFGCECVVVIGG